MTDVLWAEKLIRLDHVMKWMFLILILFQILQRNCNLFLTFIFSKGLKPMKWVDLHAKCRIMYVYQVIYDTLFCQILILCNEGKIGTKYLKIEGNGIPKNGSSM